MANRWLQATTALALLLFLPGTAGAADGDEGKMELDDLSAEQFLAVARRPFLQDAWAELEGKVQHKGPGGMVQAPLRLAVLMHRDYLRAQFTLDGTDVYNVTQSYAGTGIANVQVEQPGEIRAASLADLGVRVEDITFSFLYWELVGEEDPRRVRGHRCRVMTLRNPQTYGHVVACLSAKYVGPLRVEYYPPGAKEPARTLEFTDFKREGELYYVKTAQLRGDGWKTQVKFARAELALSQDTPPPESLFRRKSE
jgi:hypothetical protein